MSFTYRVLQEKYIQIRQNNKELAKELAYYKFLYENEKEEKTKLKKKVKEQELIIGWLADKGKVG